MVFQEKTYSVLLVSAQEKFNTAISELLPMTDYWPCVTVSSVSAAKRRLAEQDYDIVIINAPLPDDFGMRLAIDVCTESGAGVLLLVKGEMFESICAKTEPYGVVPLPRPTNRQMVSQALHMLRATRERMRRMEAKQATVEEKIEEICALLDEHEEASLFFLLKDADSRSELVARFMGVLELIKIHRIMITTVHFVEDVAEYDAQGLEMKFKLNPDYIPGDDILESEFDIAPQHDNAEGDQKNKGKA